MVDYDKSTGSTGTMRIRDTGSVVEFWLNAGNPHSFNYDLPWGYTVNGTTNNNREYRYEAGSGWEKFGSWTVTTDQTVTFRIFDTGTAIGGPTTHSVSINRASKPSTPSKPVISAITNTSMRLVWSDGSNNGATIDQRQVARNTVNSLLDATIINTDNDNVFTGLSPGTTYYWWARTHNSKGYSSWSAMASAKTTTVPDAPDQPVLSSPDQTSFVASFADNGNGGAAIVERQLAYNTTNVISGATTVSYAGVMPVTGLQPATTYYVWGRARNSAGWGPYSPVATIRTIAGAWLNVNNEWKEAIPYVKDGGVWKLARPWSRDAGVWKEAV